MYLFCLLFAGIVAFFGGISWHVGMSILLVGGFANTFASYTYWRAMKISMTKTSLYGFFTDIVSMAFCYVFLHEDAFLTLSIAIGIALVIISVIGYAITDYRKKAKDKGDNGENIRLYLYVGIFVLIWGSALFMMRYLMVGHMSAPNFLLGWYSGSMVGVLVLWGVRARTHGKIGITALIQGMMNTEIGVTAITAVAVVASLLFTYWAYETPQVIVQPIFMISAVVMPVLIGLFLYSERKKIHHAQWLYLAIGIIGAFVVAISKP
jgi:hypothetical protein